MTFTSRLLSYFLGPSKVIIILGTSAENLRSVVYDYFKLRIPVFSNDDFHIFILEENIIFVKRINNLSAGAFTRILGVVRKRAGSLPVTCILIHSRPASAFFSRRALSIIMDECESLVVMSDNGTLTTWEPLSFEDVLKITDSDSVLSGTVKSA